MVFKICDNYVENQGNPVKGSSDLNHFIFEINVGKSRIRHSLCHIERLLN